MQEKFRQWLDKKRKTNGELLLNSSAETYLNISEKFFNHCQDKNKFIYFMNEHIKNFDSPLHLATYKNILECFDFPEEEIKKLKSPKFRATALKSQRILQSKVLSIDEMKALMNYLKQTSGIIPSHIGGEIKISSLESEVLLRLLYDTACRKGEIIKTHFEGIEYEGLKVKQINFDKRELHVTGKGRKTRIVFIAPSTNELLFQLIKEKKLKPDDNVVTLNKHSGEPYVNQEYECWKFIKVLGYNVLNKNIHPHCMRHTRITHWADEGAELLDLKELAGHADPSTTMIYIHISSFRRRKAADAYCFDIDKK